MNKTDKKQFTDEVYLLGQAKEKKQSSLFVLALKGALSLKELEDILKNKRKIYNFGFVNAFKKYNVQNDDLYGDLDKVWNVSLSGKNSTAQEAAVKKLALSSTGAAVAATGSMAGAIVAAPLALFLGPLIGGGIVGYKIIKVQFKVRELWKAYKRNCVVYAETYVSQL